MTFNTTIQSSVGANVVNRDPYNLDFVLMPLVRMLAEHQLSWSNREKIAHAMLATIAHHKSMTDEMKPHAGAAMMGQQLQGGRAQFDRELAK